MLYGGPVVASGGIKPTAHVGRLRQHAHSRNVYERLVLEIPHYLGIPD